MKTRTLVGYVAVAFAGAYGCSGSPAPSILGAPTKDGGAREGGRGLVVTDASADDEGDVGADGSEGGAADATTNGTSGSTSSQYCCAGGAYYVCPTAAAVAQCTSACTHNPSKDATCGAPSASGAPGPPPPQTNACGGLFTGYACDTGGGCIGGGHCTGNQCYPNDVGNPCVYPMDCGDGNHCTNGCCASPAPGSACQAPWDCKSGTCTNGVCQ